MGKHLNVEFLHRKYIFEDLSVREIAVGCGVSHTTIHRKLQEYGIETRHREEARLLRIQKHKREERKKEAQSYLRNLPPIDADELDYIIAECEDRDPYA